jgi:hypothetical protein
MSSARIRLTLTVLTLTSAGACGVLAEDPLHTGASALSGSSLVEPLRRASTVRRLADTLLAPVASAS